MSHTELNPSSDNGTLECEEQRETKDNFLPWNEVNIAKGVTPSASPDFVPVVKSTVTYIVVGILFNEADEVLMMQEAKSSCAGKWYLPAGRMEPGEDIEEAVRREVLEETGLEMDPTTLLMMECASGTWFRFVLTGTVTAGALLHPQNKGCSFAPLHPQNQCRSFTPLRLKYSPDANILLTCGTLKTPKDADSESLQAKWVKDLNELNLRASDIQGIVERGRSYQAALRGEPWHAPLLPVLRPHNKLLFRIVVCIRKKSNNRVHLLLSEKTEVHLPVCEINPARNFHSTLKKYMTNIFGADVPAHKPHGILNVEHSGKPECIHDGLCFTILVSFRKPLEEVGIIDKYTWLEISKELGDDLLSRLPKNMVVPLHVIR
uniref:Nudix hydrolase domain-containing protein n=1 Tax=Timema douglasi TaxID=61478 RepID=A0A7R8VPR5_TIMDO|nr:unnamed protein product [Timema douglasi]